MLLVEFYKGAHDLVRFQEPWNQEHTYLDKLKVRLMLSPVQNPFFYKDLWEPRGPPAPSPSRIYPWAA